MWLILHWIVWWIFLCRKKGPFFIIEQVYSHFKQQFSCVIMWIIPANIFWSSKTSWRHLENMSWRPLQHDFSVTILRFPRRLGRRKIVYAEDVFKASWRHLLKTSSRSLGGKQNVYWEYLYLTNLNVYLRNLYFTNLYLTNLRRIHNALLRTQ